MSTQTAGIFPDGPKPNRGLVRSAGSPPEVVAFEEKVVGFFIDGAAVLGFPKSIAAIYGIVFASPIPLSFGQIEQRLDLSKGSISKGLRALQDIGALKEVSSSADRSARFQPDMEIRRVIAHFVEHRMSKQLETGRERLVALAAAVPGAGSSAQVLRERLEHLQGTHDKARALLPLAKTFLNLGS